MVAAVFVQAAGPQTGILNISSVPTGAQLKIDGKSKGVTPQILELSAGPHVIQLSAPEFEDLKTDVTIAADKVSKLQLQLKKKKPAPTLSMQVNEKLPSDAVVRVHSNKDNQKPGTILLATTPPGLTAFIDQYQIPQPTPVSFDIRPGIYELTLRSTTGEILYRKTIFVRPEECLDLDIVVRKQRSIDYSDPWR